MFREMRKSKQSLSAEEIEQILSRNTAGVLAVSGDEDYPYAVPLSYVYLNGKIYFHGAKVGHKIDSILRCDKVSFCVIDQDKIVGEEYTTYFRSVIAFGRARILEGEEKRKPLVELCEKYYPGHLDITEPKVAGALERVGLIELDIEHVTGKQAAELAMGKG
ncbi:MAG: pyridoxamine 5'-phosphate oxidase family protein [Oscillibacter sp.]|nr:pyridoxamine 5'-phosphate oxidase family protein [Oscillibacter sp.]